MIKDFKDLNVWQEGRALVNDVYKTTGQFPADERYGLVSQMRRASVSIISNIAEGFSRRNRAEYRQFLYMSRGSSAELVTQIVISADLGLLSVEDSRILEERTRVISRMLMNLIKLL